MDAKSRAILLEVLEKLIWAVGEDEARSIMREVRLRPELADGATTSDYLRSIAEITSRRTGVPNPIAPN